MDTLTKICSKCLEPKSLSEFEQRTRNRGLHSRCFSCKEKRTPEQNRATVRDYQKRMASRVDIPVPIKKVCSSCKLEKASSAFHKLKNNPNGIKPSCKTCAAKKAKIYGDALAARTGFVPTTLNKTCNVCKQEKTVSEFDLCRRIKAGIRAECKACRSAAYKAKPKDEAFREKRKAETRNWISANPERYLLKNAKDRAIKKGLEFTIKQEDIKIPSNCPVFGTPLIQSLGRGWSDNTPSLDRVDSKRGYTADNIRVISYRANVIKRDGTVEEFQKIVAYMLEHEAKTS